MKFWSKSLSVCRTLLLLPLLGSAAIAGFGQARPAFKAGEILLYMKPGAPQADVDAVVALVQPDKIEPLLLPDCYKLVLQAKDATDPNTLAAVAKLKTDARVRWVGPNQFKYITQSTGASQLIPNDPLFPSQWDMRLINMPQAWVLQQGAVNANAAVIDSGGDPNHEDLQGQYLVPGSHDFTVTDSTDPSGFSPNFTADGAGPELQHGVHVGGIIDAKANNSKGISGVCQKNVKIVMCKVHKKGDPDASVNIAAAINAWMYLAMNKDALHVVSCNMSFGGGGDPNDTTTPEYAAVKACADKGIIMIAAAGNDNADNHMFTPAGFPFVITVSALGQTGTKSSFSSFGKVELAAPGGDFDNGDAGQILSTLDSAYGVESGTSQAAPHVTGVATLLMSVPGVTPAVAIDTLEKTANRSKITGTALPDTNYGFGTVDAFAALARVSVVATIQSPDGLDTSGRSSDPNNILPPPVETFKPTLRFHLANIPPSNVVVTVDGQQVSSSLITTNIESGNTTGVFPQYNVAFRYQFPTTAPFQHTITISGTDPNSGNTSTDTRIFTITPHTIPSGISMISIPYLETAADSPTGSFRDAAQLLAPNATLYRWINTQVTTSNGVTTIAGSYAAFGAGKTDVNASLKPVDIVPTLDKNTTTDIRPIGEGYFINAPAAIPVVTFGTSFPTQAVRIPLHEGWNMIGDPYSFAVPFNATEIELPSGTRIPTGQAVDQNLILPHIYRFVGGDYSFQTLPDGTLQPWEGHWVYVVPKNSTSFNSSTVLTLVVTPTPLTNTGKAASAKTVASNTTRSTSIGGWKLRLEAHAGTLTDANNFIGMSTRATSGNDLTKVPKPPKPGNYVTLGIVRPNSPAGLYSQDLQPLGGTKEWDVMVATDQPNTNVSLAWPDIRTLPRNYRLTLTDKVTGQTIDLRNQSSYQFNSGSSAGTRGFTITAKPTNSIAGRPVITNVVVNPSLSGAGRDATIYDIGYTVSSDVSVEISVMSYGGRQIAQIGTTRAATSGDNHVTWNGRDDAGRSLPAGPYVLQLKAKTQDGEVTRVIRPLVLTGR